MPDILLVLSHLFTWKFLCILTALIALALALPERHTRIFRSVKFQYLFVHRDRDRVIRRHVSSDGTGGHPNLSRVVVLRIVGADGVRCGRMQVAR